MATYKLGRMAEMVTISVAEYESLLETGRKFLSLKHALLAGGVTTEALNVLISSTCPPTPPDEELSSVKVRIPPTTTTRSFVPLARSPASSNLGPHAAYVQTPFVSRLASPLTAEDTEEGDVQEEIGRVSGQPTCDDIATARRSLTISGLSPVATLQSLAQVLKGGAILQMYMREDYFSAHVTSAHVTFVDPSAASNFVRHAQTNDIYIGGKKVKVAWDSRQTRVQPGFLNCVQSLGRTRNLVIHSVSPSMTAASIRADLGHIHYLEVVDLFFDNGHAYISLNSIRAALTARNCMRSRLEYKGSKIDFYPDECAQPMPPTNDGLSQKPSNIKRAGFAHPNRFELLSHGLEESHESSDPVGL